MIRQRYLAGGLMAATGLAVTFEARTFGMGTMAQMGAGFFPSILGVALTIVGMLIAVSPEAAEDGEQPFGRPDWRGWACILLGVLSFILLGEYLGLAPATFACVAISASGDRMATWRATLLLATGATVMAAVIFYWLLQFQLPLLRW